jgi:uncharacterized protein (TIGR00290 family)
MRPKAFVSWSSGKDSAFALHEARRLEMVEVVGLLTTVNAVHHRVAMHGTRESLLDRQIAATGLPCLKVPLPSPCSNEVYETRMAEACAHITAQGVRHIVFGDLFLEDIRAYREARLKEAGMEGVFPLWQRNTHALAHEMIGSGMVAHLVCIDPRRIDRRFAGRRFNSDLLAELPVTADPCGENGEFHTAVSAGPMFAAPIPVEPGEVVERDGFVFADIIPATQ